MERGGVLLFSLLALAMSLHIGYLRAAVTLPPEDRPLTRHFYKKLNTCANVEAFVKHQVTLFWNQDKSITAKLFKLLYADCMVNVSTIFFITNIPLARGNSWNNDFANFLNLK